MHALQLKFTALRKIIYGKKRVFCNLWKLLGIFSGKTSDD